MRAAREKEGDPASPARRTDDDTVAVHAHSSTTPPSSGPRSTSRREGQAETTRRYPPGMWVPVQLHERTRFTRCATRPAYWAAASQVKDLVKTALGKFLRPTSVVADVGKWTTVRRSCRMARGVMAVRVRSSHRCSLAANLQPATVQVGRSHEAISPPSASQGRFGRPRDVAEPPDTRRACPSSASIFETCGPQRRAAWSFLIARTRPSLRDNLQGYRPARPEKLMTMRMLIDERHR